MKNYYYLIAALIFAIIKGLYDNRKAKKQYGAYRVTYSCHGYFNHEHRFDFTSRICKLFQEIVNMKVLHPFLLKKFNPKKYLKIKLAMKYGRRALIRRVKKGQKAI